MAVLLSAREVAAELGVSAQRVYQMCAEGSLPHVRLGRTGWAVRIPRTAFEAWISHLGETAMVAVQKGVGDES